LGEKCLGRSAPGRWFVKRKMPLQEDFTAVIYRSLHSGDIQIRVARPVHDNTWPNAGRIGGPAWRGGTGGSDQNQQLSDSHVGMMWPACGEND